MQLGCNPCGLCHDVTYPGGKHNSGQVQDAADNDEEDGWSPAFLQVLREDVHQCGVGGRHQRELEGNM